MTWEWRNNPSSESSTSDKPSAWKRFWTWVDEPSKSHPQDKLSDFVNPDREKSLMDEFATGIWQYQFSNSTAKDLKLVRSESRYDQAVLRNRYLFTNKGSGRTTWNERVFTVTETSPTSATMTMEVYSLGNMATPNPDKSYSFRKLLNRYEGEGQRGFLAGSNLLTWRFSYHHKKSGHFGRTSGASDNSGIFDLKQTSQLSYKGL